MILSCAKETISSLHQQPTIIIRTSELYHYKAAIRLEGEELERSFAAALERPDVLILLGVLDGIITQSRFRWNQSASTEFSTALVLVPWRTSVFLPVSTWFNQNHRRRKLRPESHGGAASDIE